MRSFVHLLVGLLAMSSAGVGVLACSDAKTSAADAGVRDGATGSDAAGDAPVGSDSGRDAASDVVTKDASGCLQDLSTFDIINDGFTAYNVDGASNASLSLCRGYTYEFLVDAAGHPFWIKTAQTVGQGDGYAGATNNGVDTGKVTLKIAGDAPATLYYICEFHGGMTGVINVKDP